MTQANIRGPHYGSERILLLRQQIRQYLCEPSFSDGITAGRPLFDACILWEYRTRTMLAGSGASAAKLSGFLGQLALQGKLPRPQQNAKHLLETDGGCVLLSYELWESSGVPVAVSFPIDAKAAAEVCKAFVPRLSVHLSTDQRHEKRTDGGQIMRLGMLFDLIAAARDTLLPPIHRAEALAAIFGLTREQFDLSAQFPPSEPSALVPLLCRLLETASNYCKGSNCYEKV